MNAFFVRCALAALTGILTFTMTATAQEDTAHHRAVYNGINAREKTYTKVTGTYKDEPLEFALTGWLDNGQVRKIVAISDEDGAGVEEIYLENEKPLFVFTTYNQNHLSKKPVKIENRLYFKDGEIFKWLTTDKSGQVLHGEDYVSETERLNGNCAAFVKVLKGKATGVTTNTNKVTEGVFVGIEQGDYAHWNMRNAKGEDVSFFVLKPDASVEKVLENAEAYAGKKCRVVWKKSTENIPEAGGKIEVEQVVSVEWLGKK